MSITLTQIRSRVLTLVNDTGVTANTTSFYTEKVNDAQREMAEELKPFVTLSSLSSVSGTQEYTLPTGFMELYSDVDFSGAIVYTNSASTRFLPTLQDRDQLLYISDLTTKTGNPVYYYLTEKTIGFYPLPNYSGSSNIKLYHYSYADTLSNDSDISTFKDAWINAIAYKAAALVRLANEQEDKAAIMNRMYSMEVARVSGMTHKPQNGNTHFSIGYLG